MNTSRALAGLDALRRQARATFDASGGRCWSCRDTGARALGVACDCPAGLGYRAQLQERERENRARLLAMSGMPAEMRGRTLASFPRQGPYTRALARYVASWDGHAGLILTGSLGTGKSSLTAAVVRELAAAHGGRIAWYTAAGYLADLRAAMNERDSDHYARLLARGREARYFVLDDIGRANVGEWVSETLFLVINSRYDAGLATFATSNYGLDGELAARLGEHGAAICDRLRETCYALTLAGSSMRRSLSLEV